MIKELNPNSCIPLYRQLMEAIRDSIASGELKPDDRIPTELELSRMYGISRITVRNAVEELVEDGLLIRRQGKGTFVTPNRLERNLAVALSFSQACQLAGKKPESKVLSAGLREAGVRDQEWFGLEPGDKVLAIVRVRCADGVPILVETTTFREDKSFLLEEDLSGSLYEIFRRRGMAVAHGYKEIEITYATRQEQELLDVTAGTALLLMHDLVNDQDMQPLVHSKSVIRSDMYKVTLDRRIAPK